MHAPILIYIIIPSLNIKGLYIQHISTVIQNTNHKYAYRYVSTTGLLTDSTASLASDYKVNQGGVRIIFWKVLDFQGCQRKRNFVIIVPPDLYNRGVQA